MTFDIKYGWNLILIIYFNLKYHLKLFGHGKAVKILSQNMS